MLGEISGQAKLLILSEIVTVTPHQGKQPAILGANSVDIPPARQEMMIDEPNDMEAVGHDAGVRKVQPHQTTVAGGQVHAYHSYLRPALQLLKIGLQRELRPAQDHVVDFVIS